MTDTRLHATALTDADRAVLVELAPVLRRGVSLDPGVLARLRLGPHTAGVLVRLPFAVLVARTVESPPRPTATDVAVTAADALAWIDGVRDTPPDARDHDWRTGLPPAEGWTRLESVPDDVIRTLVRQGALALKDAATREGVPGAQPRAEVADALLDSVVLIASTDDATPTDPPRTADHQTEDHQTEDHRTGDHRTGDHRAEVTLRALSALTRMGFLPRGGTAHIDVRGRWIRVVGGYGTVFLEGRRGGLVVR